MINVWRTFDFIWRVFFLLFKGPGGDDGKPGEQGAPGPPGQPGLQGQPGFAGESVSWPFT